MRKCNSEFLQKDLNQLNQYFPHYKLNLQKLKHQAEV